MSDKESLPAGSALDHALDLLAERYRPTAQPPFDELVSRRRRRIWRRAAIGVAATAIAATAVTVGPTLLNQDTSTLAPGSTPDVTGSPLASEQPVADQPATNTNWDSPVAWGIDVTEETARQVAQADFDVRVPDLKGELLKIQATDPAEYPEDGGRGYGVLYDVATGDGQSQVARLLIEETLALPSDDGLARALSGNGSGFALEVVDGVEVCFIDPAGAASAVFVHDGIKFNVQGPALPMPVVRAAVAAIIKLPPD